MLQQKSSLILHYNSPECRALTACKHYKQQFAQVHNNINNIITLLDYLKKPICDWICQNPA